MTDAAHGALRLLEAGDAKGVLELLAPPDPAEVGAEERLERATLRGRAATALGRYDEARSHFAAGLWRSRRRPLMRAPIRMYLANLLMNAGHLGRAERQLRRALTEVRARQQNLELEPRLLSYLAGIHRRRGMLSASIRIHEEALARALAMGLPRWGAFAGNLVNALIVHGDYRRADELLSQIEQAPECLHPIQQPYVPVMRAILAFEIDDFDGAERALTADPVRFERLEAANQVVYRITLAELWLRRGRPQRARLELEALSAKIDGEPSLAVAASGVAVRLAEALLLLGEPEAALTRAQMAVRLGRASDAYDTSAAMRIAARCLAAIGRRDAAHATLVEAQVILGPTEFIPEQRRLEQTARELGFELSPLVPHQPTVVASRPPRREANWLPLRDGRAFLTTDARLATTIRRAAVDDLPVLIEGETGTGKELVAHLLHELGPRSAGPLVVVDCATLPENLIEAELFGVARGAFTGATSDRAGLVGDADGGTLFLDELTELPPALQAKLLRLLQEGTYRRVGETRSRTVRTRFVAATNRNVNELLSHGLLKADLFYRLNGHRLALRPLRERPDELRLLAAEFARSMGLLGVSLEAQRQLEEYAWPGNVRELQMLVRAAGAHVTAGEWVDGRALAAAGFRPGAAENSSTLRLRKREVERDAIRLALESANGNVTAAARVLGISRQALYKALKRSAR